MELLEQFPDEPDLNAVCEVQWIVRLSEHGLGDCTTAYWTSWEGINVSFGAAAKLSTAPAWNPQKNYFENHSAELKYSQVNWGASGDALTFLLDLGTDAASDLIIGGLGYAIARMRKSPSPAHSSADEIESAHHIAEEAILRTFGLSELTVIEITREPSEGVTVRFRTTEGEIVNAFVSGLSCGVPYVRIDRSAA